VVNIDDRTQVLKKGIRLGKLEPAEVIEPKENHAKASEPKEKVDIIRQDKQVTEMEEHGIIEPTASPWASNVVLVRKNDGSLRFCIDYCQLNRITTQDSVWEQSCHKNNSAPKES